MTIDSLNANAEGQVRSKGVLLNKQSKIAAPSWHTLSLRSTQRQRDSVHSKADNGR
jgi:hypothetical protein